MKVVCTQENLSAGLAAVGHLASKSTTLPILNNVLLRAEHGGIRISATNLEIGITRHIRGKVEEEGSMTVPGRVFADYVALCTEQAMTLEQDGATLLLRGERGETTLRGMPAEEFPLIPDLERKNPVTCEAKALREAITQVLFAAAADDTRPEISGVFLRFQENHGTLVATDSYRLAEKHLTVSGGPAEQASIIVPVRALQELSRVLSQGAESVQVFLGENQILFTADDTELISRLIDGQYPQYEQIIPTSYETEAVLETQKLLRAVRAGSLFSRPGINDLTLLLSPKTKTVTLRSSNAQVGDNRQELEAEIDGKDNTIVFNSRYLLDGLSGLSSDGVRVQLTNNASPGVFRPVGGDDYLYMIMPIKQ